MKNISRGMITCSIALILACGLAVSGSAYALAGNITKYTPVAGGYKATMPNLATLEQIANETIPQSVSTVKGAARLWSAEAAQPLSAGAAVGFGSDGAVLAATAETGISGEAIASAIGEAAVTGRLTPAGVAAFALPVLAEAGYQYWKNKNGQSAWSKPDPADSGIPKTVTSCSDGIHTESTCSAVCAYYKDDVVEYWDPSQPNFCLGNFNGKVGQPARGITPNGLNCPDQTVNDPNRPGYCTNITPNYIPVTIDDMEKVVMARLNQDQSVNTWSDALHDAATYSPNTTIPADSPQKIAVSPSVQVGDKVRTSTQTATAPDGTTKTTTKDQQDTVTATPTGDTVNDTGIDVTKSSTTTTTNPDGTTTTDTTSDTPTKPDPTPTPEPTPPTFDNPDFATVPDFWKTKYPDGFTGVWDDLGPQLKQTAFLQSLNKFIPSVGGGSCPVWTVNLNVARWASYGSGDLSIPCWIFGVIKAMVLLCAAFAARKLIWG